ncbi:MAG: nucleotidyltransferase family protein [Pseudomonadota bacterium]
MIEEQAIVGILLAAGAGTRFGGGKLVHPLDDGIAIAVHAARNLSAAGLHVVAVVRPADLQLADMLEKEGCTVTPCAEAVHGMGHTLAHGVASSKDAAGWVVALADMPHIRAVTIAAVIDAIKSGSLIAAPHFKGVRAHPVGFAAILRDELVRLSGDSGAKSLLQRHAGDVRLIETDDPGVMLDIDRKTDLGRVA